ncbi:MAG: DndE family protein [Campylobacterota bacterium]|nr:DndE family protein [Campylobacterota bacterium]
MRTSEHTEENLDRIAKYLGFEKEPKWLTLRFAIFTSLSLDEKINNDSSIDFTGGKSYAWDVLTGKSKNELHGDQADYHNLMALIVANNDNTQISNDKDFEKALEYHCERGFNILASSWKDKSDVFEWLGQEFK